MNSPPFIHLLFFAIGYLVEFCDFLSVQRTGYEPYSAYHLHSSAKMYLGYEHTGWDGDSLKKANIPFKEAMPTCFPKRSHQFILPPIIKDSSEFMPSSMLSSVRLLNLYQQDR